MMSEMAQQAERHRQEIAVRDSMIAAALLGDQQQLLQQQQTTQLNPEAVRTLEELASVIAKHEGKGKLSLLKSKIFSIPNNSAIEQLNWSLDMNFWLSNGYVVTEYRGTAWKILP